MPPISHRSLASRNVPGDKTYYVVILPALVVAVFLGAMLWSYIGPKWKRSRVSRPSQSRHDDQSETSTQQPQSVHSTRFPFVFPPHPAVVVPQDKSSRLGHKPSVKYNTVPIPIYDPRVQSPFPKWPRLESSDKSILGGLTRRQIVIPPRRMPYLYGGKLALSDPGPSAARTYTRKYLRGNSSKELMLVAKCAGGLPLKPASVYLATERRVPSAHSELSPAGSGFTLESLQGRLAWDEDTARKQAVLPASMRSHHHRLDHRSTPTRSMPQVRNHFETPSSLGTSMSTFGSPPYCSRKFSTPLTAPNVSLDQIPVGTGSSGNISRLVPCRRLKGPFISSKSKKTSHLVCQEPNLPTSTSERISSGQTDQIAYRPISSKPPREETFLGMHDLSSTSANPAEHHPAERIREATGTNVAERNMTIDLRPRRTVSMLSRASSRDLLSLFPKPLSFRRTFAGRSPWSAPTVIGRNVRDTSSPAEVSGRQTAALSTPSRRQSRRPGSSRCRLSDLGISHRHVADRKCSIDPNERDDPFVSYVQHVQRDRGHVRSSFASSLTLKPPRIFRSNSRAGSSIYSRDIRGVSLPSSPALFDQGSTRAPPAPADEQGRGTTSFDETIFKDLDWVREMTGENQDLSKITNMVEKRERALQANLSATQQTVPRNSDDVFGVRSQTEVCKDLARAVGDRKRDSVVVEDGRMLKRIRPLDAKLSEEDLRRYGSETAPGGVAWF